MFSRLDKGFHSSIEKNVVARDALKDVLTTVQMFSPQAVNKRWKSQTQTHRVLLFHLGQASFSLSRFISATHDATLSSPRLSFTQTDVLTLKWPSSSQYNERM